MIKAKRIKRDRDMYGLNLKRLRIVSSVLALCLLMLIMLIGTMGPTLAQSTVDGSVAIYMGDYGYPWQTRSFDANGLRWIFYRDTAPVNGEYYRTSADGGETWSTATYVRSVTKNFHFVVWFDGTYGHYAAIYGASETNEQLYYRRFTPNGDGTLTFSAAEQTIMSGQNLDGLSLCVDTSGKPCIAYRNVTTGGWAIRSSTNDGTWVTDASFTEAIDRYAAILPLTSGKIATVWASTSGIGVKRWTGAAWGAIKYSVPDAVGDAYFSAVAQDDDVHIAFMEITTYDVTYIKWNYSTNNFSADVTLHAAATTTSIPKIQLNTNNNDIFIYWENDPTDDHIYFAWYDSGTATWTTDIDWINESIMDGLPANGYLLNCDYTYSGNTSGLYYIAGTTILKYKSKVSQLDVDTLEPTGVTETQATLRGEIVSIDYGTPIERGFYWDTIPSLGNTTGTLINWHETGSFGTGVFNHTTDVTEELDYYYIAYASGNETAYGEWVEFNPGATDGWKVLTLDPANVQAFSATFNAQIIELAGTYATVRGFEWGYTAVATWDWHQDGNYTLGTYSYTPTDLEADQIYYVRAYVGNSTAVDYGLWIGFITKVPTYLDLSDTTSIADITVPTTAPGGWVRSGKTYDGFPFTELLNAAADISIGRSFMWFVIEVALIVLLTIASAKYVRNIYIAFCILLILFLIPFIAFEYLDWWMLAPFILVFAAFAIKEGEYSWS